MRKVLCFLLMLGCVAGIFGCASSEKTPEHSFAAYYKKVQTTYGSSDGVIAPTYLDAAGHEEEYGYLLNQYLNTVPGDGFAPTFPLGVRLHSFKLEGLTAKVVLNDRMADSTGMALTIALTCLTRTVMELTGCQEVIISALSKQLDGQNFVTLSRDSYLLTDDSGLSANE